MGHAGAVAHEHTFGHQTVIETAGIVDFDQQKVGVGVVDALHTGIFGQLRSQAFAFALYHLDLRGDVAAELAEDFALGGTVEVVGIFDVGKYGGYARVGKKAIPTRRLASPQALENVCSTMMLG